MTQRHRDKPMTHEELAAYKNLSTQFADTPNISTSLMGEAIIRLRLIATIEEKARAIGDAKTERDHFESECARLREAHDREYQKRVDLETALDLAKGEIEALEGKLKKRAPTPPTGKPVMDNPYRAPSPLEMEALKDESHAAYISGNHPLILQHEAPVRCRLITAPEK